MVILVTDAGFSPDDWADGFVPLAAVCPEPGADVGALAVDISSPDLALRDWLRLVGLCKRMAMVRIRLRHFGDVKGFDLATSLRRKGFGGRIRGHGAVLAGHYTLARRAGFSEIELMPHQAQRQPPEHWRIDPAWSPARRPSLPGFDWPAPDRHRSPNR